MRESGFNIECFFDFNGLEAYGESYRENDRENDREDAFLSENKLSNFKKVREFGEHPQEKPGYKIKKKIPQVCARACEIRCHFKVVVGVDENTGLERAITLEGVNEDPISRGNYCIKGMGFVDSMYDPDRIIEPLKRTNSERGEGVDPGWVKTDLDKAIDEIIEKLGDFEKDEVLMMSPGDPFTNRLCKSTGWRRTDQRNECFGTGYYLNSLMITNPPNSFYSSSYSPNHHIWSFDYTESDYQIWLGFDSFSKCGKAGLMNHIAEAKRKGTKFVFFNPIKTPIAEGLANEWYPIKPGTDLAVILAMLRTVVLEKLYDVEFLRDFTDATALIDLERKMHLVDEKGEFVAWDEHWGGVKNINEAKSPALEGSFNFLHNDREVLAKPVFELLRDALKNYTPVWAQDVSEVRAGDIERIAREFMRASPRAFIPSLKRDAAGPNYANSWKLRQAINIMNALAGSIDHEGGVLMLHDNKVPWLEDLTDFEEKFPSQAKWSPDYRQEFPVTEDIYINKDFSAPGSYGMVGWGLFKEKKTKAIIFRNPHRGLYALLQPQMVEKALKDIELIVDYNMYLTDAAFWADYILPGGHNFEAPKLDILLYNPKHPGFVGGKPVQAAPGQCAGWGYIASKIGRALAPKFWSTDGSGDVKKAIPTDMPGEALRRKGVAKNVDDFIEKYDGVWVDVEKPYPNRETLRKIAYNRPNGRMRLYIDEFAREGYDPLVSWFPRYTEPEGEYKFSTCISRAPWLLHVDPNFVNNPALKHLSRRNNIDTVWINPGVADELELLEGEEVLLETNPRYLNDLPRPVKARVHISKRVAREDCILLFHNTGYRIKDLTHAVNFGYRDGDLIPQKDPETVKEKDPIGMGWVEDVHVRIKKVNGEYRGEKK